MKTTVSWKCEPCAPERVRVWLCDSYYDSTFYDVEATIVERAESGSVVLRFDNGYRISPGLKMDRWVITQALRWVKPLGAKPVSRTIAPNYYGSPQCGGAQ